MKNLARLVIIVGVTALAALSIDYSAPPASAHRNRCHTAHTCPSDHATYRWGPRKLLCVKPTSDKRNATFKIRIRHAGLTYLCKR